MKLHWTQARHCPCCVVKVWQDINGNIRCNHRAWCKWASEKSTGKNRHRKKVRTVIPTIGKEIFDRAFANFEDEQLGLSVKHCNLRSDPDNYRKDRKKAAKRFVMNCINQLKEK